MGIFCLQDGSRRRTSGGVYLFLVKNDTSISKEDQNEIFKDSREEFLRQNKLKKAQKRQAHRERLKALGIGTTATQDNESETTAAEAPSKMEEDGGLDEDVPNIQLDF